MSSIETLNSKLSKKQHVSLIINNDHVLTKCIEGHSLKSEKLVYNAFPNIKLDDFYFETILQGNTYFVSICRKDYIHQLIADYKAQSFYVINISLGNLIVSGISSFINTDIFFTSNASVSIEGGALNSIKKTEIKDIVDYNINGLQVDNNHLLSLAAALDSVIQRFKSETNFDALKQSLKSDYRQSRFFTLFLKTGLVTILSVLLINFFVFNHYFGEVSTLQQTSQINQSTKQKILKLDEAVNKSKKMVDDMLKSSTSKSSFYTNVLIQSLPNSVLLSELNYQPLLKRIKKDKPVEIGFNIFLVSGMSNNSESFSTWIASLESLDWIDQVDILSYKDISKSNSEFSLQIHIVHD